MNWQKAYQPFDAIQRNTLRENINIMLGLKSTLQAETFMINQITVDADPSAAGTNSGTIAAHELLTFISKT
jgi:hypothetical protein